MTFEESERNSFDGDWLTGDHIPSIAAIWKYVKDMVPDLGPEAYEILRQNTNVIIVDYDLHKAGRTFAGKNKALKVTDGVSISTLLSAQDEDEKAHIRNATRLGYDVDALTKAFEKLNDRNATLFKKLETTKGIRDFFKKFGL